jgi:hypothetical protein
MYRVGLPINPLFVDEQVYYNSFDAEVRSFGTSSSYYCISLDWRYCRTGPACDSA